MPFLHGFRRIVYEYQPLVDEVMCLVGLEGENEVCRSLQDLLDRECQSAVFVKGISCALFKVAERGNLTAAKVLLRNGAEVDFEDPVSYYNALHIAVLRNRPNMIRLLVEHGADIDKRDRIHESSPLDLASEEAERLPCLRTLLDLGADVNAKDRNGKTALLHALASSDGLIVNNTDNIQLLLERGADIFASTHDGETAMSLLVFLVKEALDGSPEDAAEIGQFCVRAAQLLLTHGADPSCCLAAGAEVEEEEEEEGEPSLTQTCLEHFDLLFPLACLVLQRGASFFCTRHGVSCWTGHRLIFGRLASVLKENLDATGVADLLAKAEVLLDLALVCCPVLPSLSSNIELPLVGQDPHAQVLQDLHSRLKDQEAQPLPLRCLCRAFIRHCLQPWPLEDKVRALPLPDRLKEYLLPEQKLLSRPGWDCCKPNRTLR
uniref:SOCS box domain-containing protein n=1 Tax=Denticeps clupeoides TaxID=299321 RepID=A0AAY4BNV4_9TELE